VLGTQSPNCRAMSVPISSFCIWKMRVTQKTEKPSSSDVALFSAGVRWHPQRKLIS